MGGSGNDTSTSIPKSHPEVEGEDSKGSKLLQVELQWTQRVTNRCSCRSQPPRRSRSSSASVAASSLSRKSPRERSTWLGGTSSSRNAAEESFRTSTPEVPRTAASEETTATCSPRRCSAASRSISVSASGAQRTSSRPCVSSGPWPSKTRTPRAPLPATQPASRSRSCSGDSKAPAWRRLKPSNRYSVGSAIPLPAGLVEQERRRNADVERLHVAELRDRDRQVARAADERAEPLPLGAEDEGEAAGEIGLPHRRRVLGVRSDDPQIARLDLLEIAREIRDDGDRHVLDRAGGGTAHGGRDESGAVRRDDDAGRSRPLGAPDHGAEVARVADLVEAREQRPFDARELIRVGVDERLAPG